MNIRLPKLRTNEWFFFLSYGLFLVFSILNTSFYARFLQRIVDPLLLICAVLVVAPELLLIRYTRKGFTRFVIFLTVSILMLFIGGGAFMCIFLYVYCGRKYHIDRILNFSLIVSMITVSFIIVSAYLGLIENYVNYLPGRTRGFMGFTYALNAPCYLFNITSLTVYKYKNSIKWSTLLLIIVANLWVFSVTNSRLSFVLSMVIILVAAWMKVRPQTSVVARKVLFPMFVFVIPICFLFSVYVTFSFNSGIRWMNILDMLSGGRFYLGNKSISQYGIGLFGRQVKWIGSGLNIYGERAVGEYLYVDNIYINILQRYGIVFAIVYVVLFTHAARQSYLKQDYLLLIILSMLAIRGILDDLSLWLHYNTFWFAVSYAMMDYIQLKRSRLGTKARL